MLYASKREKCVALSSTEAEMIAASMAVCDLIYIRMLMKHLGMETANPLPLLIDNKGVVDLSRDPMSTTTMKHVRRRHFFVREAQEGGEVYVLPVESARNVADVLTKVVGAPRYHELCKKLRGGK